MLEENASVFAYGATGAGKTHTVRERGARGRARPCASAALT